MVPQWCLSGASLVSQWCLIGVPVVSLTSMFPRESSTVLRSIAQLRILTDLWDLWDFPVSIHPWIHPDFVKNLELLINPGFETPPNPGFYPNISKSGPTATRIVNLSKTVKTGVKQWKRCPNGEKCQNQCLCMRQSAKMSVFDTKCTKCTPRRKPGISVSPNPTLSSGSRTEMVNNSLFFSVLPGTAPRLSQAHP